MSLRLRLVLVFFFVAFSTTPGCMCNECGRLIGNSDRILLGNGSSTINLALECEDIETQWWISLMRVRGIRQSKADRWGSGALGDPARLIGSASTFKSDSFDPVTVALEDARGRVFVGGSFFKLDAPTGPQVMTRNVGRWDPGAADGEGEWQPLSAGLNAPVHALIFGPDSTLYAGGRFTTSPIGVGQVAMSRLARWDAVARLWRPVGGGIRGGSSPQINQMAFDASGRLVVAGYFWEAVNADGSVVPANGVARWDLVSETWTAIGDGFFESPTMTGLVVGSGDEVIVSGLLLPTGGSQTHAVMRWNGTSWAPYEELLGTLTNGADELSLDSDGTRYVRYFSSSDPDGSPNPGFRVARRGPTDPGWTVLLAAERITGMGADHEEPGVSISGRFTEVNGQPTNGDAFWDGAQLRPVDSPGTCSDLQLINTIPDPSAMPVDVVFGNVDVADGFTFGSATPRMTLPIGEPTSASLVLAASAPTRWASRLLRGAGTDTLTTLRGVVLQDRSCVAAPIGVFDPDDFAPNPNGRSIRLTYASVDVPSGLNGRGGAASLMVLHAVPDAPLMSILVNGSFVESGLAYGRFARPIELEPGIHEVTLRQTVSGQHVATFQADLSSAADEWRTVTLSGFMDPAANQKGPAMRVSLIDEAGVSTQLATSSDAGPAGPATRLRVLASYPNPFRTSATVSVTVPEPGHVRLTVHDMLGREVAVLIDAELAAGVHDISYRPNDLPGGFYAFRVAAGAASHARNFVLVR